jgi:hypothetical protein
VSQRTAPILGILIIAALIITIPAYNVVFCSEQTSIPLIKTHAHNDYLHDKPLYEALEHGFTSIEVDILLVYGKLMVAHDLWKIKPEWTLQSLYLDPLQDLVHLNEGSVYPDWPHSVILLIDIKSEAEPTYELLREVLAEYEDMLTTFTPESTNLGAITVIISGNRPKTVMENEDFRYAAMDGRLEDLKTDINPNLIPLISDNWKKHFSWQGNGPMPEEERLKLREIVNSAHEQGVKIRFWATPDGPDVWEELLAADVDLINTDDLGGLQKFLMEHCF